MYHSITFGDKNTWDDWHLIPASRPFVAPPQVNTQVLDIPGMNGSLDITEVLTGYPTYKNRQGAIQFYVMHEYWSSWAQTYSEIMKYLHGRKMRMILEDDPGYYYDGRYSVSQWTSGQNYSSITINYDVYPYKISMNSSSDEAWLWDPFDFVNGVIRNWGNITVDGSHSIIFDGEIEPVVPTIVATVPLGGSLSVEYEYPYFGDGENDPRGDISTFSLVTGENVFRKIVIREGQNRLTFTGHGTVSVKYKGGRF